MTIPVSPSKIQIISRAFVILGNKPINSIDVDNPNHIAAQDLYDMILPSMLQQTWWRFARRTEILNKLSTAPPEEFGYTTAFQLPANPQSLLLYKLYPQINYRIDGNIIYIDSDTLSITYISYIEESKFPPHFTNSLIYSLAAELAARVTEDFKVVMLITEKAEKILLRALAIEGSEEPNHIIQSDPFLEAHLDG